MGPPSAWIANAPSSGAAIPLVEVVDEFLRSDTGRIGQMTVRDVPPGDRVGGGVDVEGERRDLVLVGSTYGLVPGSWNVTPSYGVGRSGRVAASAGGAPDRGLAGASAWLEAVPCKRPPRGRHGQGQECVRMTRPPCRGARGGTRPTWAGPESGPAGPGAVATSAPSGRRLTPGAGRFPRCPPLPPGASRRLRNAASTAPSWLRIRAVAPHTDRPSTSYAP